MSDLNSLYKEREIFEKYGKEIPTELLVKIEETERELIQCNIVDVISFTLPKTIDTEGMMKPITVAVSYVEGKLDRMGISFDNNAIDLFDIVEDFTEVEPESREGGDSDRIRSASKSFKVIFVDEDKEVRSNNALMTMIEALKYMGLERVSQFRGETFKGFPLVGKQQRTDGGHTWQKMVDGWWIYSNMTNSRKIICLQKVAAMLGINIKVEDI